jgi:hypothetical protein
VGYVIFRVWPAKPHEADKIDWSHSVVEENAMRIFFERSGGFAGQTLTAELDTTSLPADEAHNIHKMVEDAGFFHLSTSIPPPARGADAFQYVVTVEQKGKQYTVRITDITAPHALRPLLEHLVKVAKAKKGG